MSSRQQSSSDDDKLQSDAVHVDLSQGDNLSAGTNGEGKQASALLRNVDPARQITITWKNVNVFVPVFSAKKSVLKEPKQLLGPFAPGHQKQKEKRQVLFHAQGIARPGQFMALMGPSGSGKTTLVSVIGGRTAASMRVEGDILFNGRPLSRRIKRDVGFVLQDDLLFDSLTVHETLLYAARLRLPRTMSIDEKRERVESVITALGLTKVRGTLVGGAMRRGVSGGERKRVSVAHELLIDPSVLILDEPTSGLDSTTAMNLVFALHDLAQGGRTLITTIHQPSSRLYQQLDELILMSDGHVMYSGRGSQAARWFGYLGCQLPYGVNVADFVLDLASGAFEHDQPVLGATGADRQKRLIEVSDEFLETCGDGFHGEDDLHHLKHLSVDPDKQTAGGKLRSGVVPSSPRKLEVKRIDDKQSDKKVKRLGAGYMEQLQVLSIRAVRTRRFEALGMLKFVQFIAVAVVAGLLWLNRAKDRDLLAAQDTAALCFFELLFLSFGQLFAALFVFPSELPMLLKERSSDMYRLSAYYIARSVATLGIDLLYPTMFVTIFYWLGGLRPEIQWFIVNWLCVLLIALTAQSIGYLFGAAFGTVQKAQTAATVTMLTLILCSGFWIKEVPNWLEWLKYCSFVYWGYSLLLKIQFHDRVYYDYGLRDGALVSGAPLPDPVRIPDVTSTLALPRNVNETMWIEVGILFAMLITFRSAIYLVLRHKTRKT